MNATRQITAADVTASLEYQVRDLTEAFQAAAELLVAGHPGENVERYAADLRAARQRLADYQLWLAMLDGGYYRTPQALELAGARAAEIERQVAGAVLTAAA